MDKIQKIGYACINLSLSNCNVGHTTTRSAFNKKGIAWIDELILKNIQDLKRVIEWNINNNISAYRLPDDFFPLKRYYSFENLPNIKTIVLELKDIGDFCRVHNHRLSFHPGPFNVLCSNKQEVVDKTILELNKSSDIFDLMGYNADNNTKINIHIGASYNDKTSAIDRFCNNFYKLNCTTHKRLTVENDDKKNMYVIEDLMKVHDRIGIPITFDTFHYHLNPGNLNYKEAFDLAMSTWPKDIVPTIHHSNSKLKYEFKDKRILQSAHSDYIYEKAETFDKEVIIMLEAKMKDLAALRYLEQFRF